MSLRGTRIAAALAVALGAALGLPAVYATSMNGVMNLAALVRESPVIVVGTVTDVATRHVGNLPCSEITIEVSQTIRGSVERTLSFRQLNVPAVQPPADGRRYAGVIAGMPQYLQGERVLLFLGAPGAQGLRTTVGLQQGKFVLAGGLVQNEFQNRGLFRNIDTRGARLNVDETALLATTAGGVSANAFVGLLGRAVSENWWGSPPTAGGAFRQRTGTSTSQALQAK